MFAIGPTEVTIGENYTNNVIVSGGDSPFTFTLVSGELPDGIRLSDGGTLSGAPREEGRFDFTVRATNEYGHFGTQSLTLTVLGAGSEPTITNVSPSTGPAEGGTSVVITGTNLTDATAVTFGGAPAASFAVITATTEAHAQGSVDVAVTTPGGSATAAGAFTYDAPAVQSLSIDDVSVIEGNLATFTVLLIPPAGPGGVTFDIATADGTAIAGIDYAASSLTSQTIPAGSTNYTFSVQTFTDALSEGNESFSVNVSNVVGAAVLSSQGTGTILDNDAPAAPTVSWSVSGGTSTNAIATAGGAPLSSGDSVTAGSIVEFLIAPANGGTYTEAPTGCGVQYISSSASGDLWRTGPITVDCAVSFTVRWVEILPPSQDGLAATRGQPYSVQFTVGNDYGPFTDWSWLRTLGVFPAGLSLDAATGLLSGTPEETGTFNFIVDVRNDVGHHNFSAYTLTVTDPIPTITGISPTTGSTAGGTSVVITGTDLTGATAVMFGGTAATSFTVDSATQITATTPAHAEGPVDVVVTTHSGDNTATGAFTYTAPVLPSLSISDITTTEGNSGSQLVYFRLTLSEPAGPAGVTMDIATADGTATAGDDYEANSVTGVSFMEGYADRPFSVEIFGDTLNEPDETFFVNVTNVVGATVVKGQGVGTIVNDDSPAPTVTSLAPTSGPTAGGTSVVITGTELAGATAVTFGGIAAASFTVDSATQITATTPAHAEGAADLVVTTPGGSATATGAFTYEVPASNDASLSNLLISAGTLNPAFAPGTTGYTVSVPSAVSSLTLTPTTADAGATITINGQMEWTPFRRTVGGWV